MLRITYEMVRAAAQEHDLTLIRDNFLDKEDDTIFCCGLGSIYIQENPDTKRDSELGEASYGFWGDMVIGYLMDDGYDYEYLSGYQAGWDGAAQDSDLVENVTYIKGWIDGYTAAKILIEDEEM